jgi:hypothetical protein
VICISLSVLFCFVFERHCLANWIQKEDATTCYLQETLLIEGNKHCLGVKGWNKIYQTNGPPKQTEVPVLTSDKVDFKPKLVKRHKGHFILIKGAIQEEITVINLYAPNVSIPIL